MCNSALENSAIEDKNVYVFLRDVTSTLSIWIRLI